MKKYCKLLFKSNINELDYAFEADGELNGDFSDIITIDAKEILEGNVINGRYKINLKEQSIIIDRKGIYSSNFYFKKGHTFQSVYSSPYGNIVSKMQAVDVSIKQRGNLMAVNLVYKNLSNGENDLNTISITIKILKS